MAVASMVKRTIVLSNTNSIKAQAVDADILNAVRAYNPVIEVQDNNQVSYTFVLTPSQDTTLQTFMSSWASRLGVPQLETHSFTINYGHA